VIEINNYVTDKDCNYLSFKVGSGYKVGDKIPYYMKMQDGNVTVITNTGSMMNYAYTWLNYSLYFKAGDYVQDNTPSSTEGGTTHVYSLLVKHS